jgi:uncharacterized protein with PQ loop repeat
MQRASRTELVVRRLAYIVGLAGSFTALPQVLSIWTYQQAAVVTVLVIHFFNVPRNFFDSRPAMILP